MAVNKTAMERLTDWRLLPPPESARALRSDAGLTQAQMASALGVDRATISRWESGSVRPRSSHRVTYADLLSQLREAVGHD